MMQRKWFSCTLFLAFVLGGGLEARAQSPEAVIGAEQHLTVGGDINGTYLGYGKRWIGGAGANVDATLNRHLGAEGEANFTFYRTGGTFGGTHITTYLGGPRYQFNAMGSNYRFRPYAKFLVGAVQYSFYKNYGSGSYFMMAPGGGVDYRLNYRWRLRLVDFEYQYPLQFSFGGSQNYAITTGVRYTIR